MLCIFCGELRSFVLDVERTACSWRPTPFARRPWWGPWDGVTEALLKGLVVVVGTIGFYNLMKIAEPDFEQTLQGKCIVCLWGVHAPLDAFVHLRA